ncbi:MAG TPA: HAMP domain-containing sensor histidine kinase [Polyangiaceae bacterium]
MAERRERIAFRRSVAARVLASYALVTLAFASVAGFSIVSQHTAARETELVRNGYFPLALAVRDLVAKQDTWNTQLNHITAAKNPTDIHFWLSESLRSGRPQTFSEVREAIALAFLADRSSETRKVGETLTREADEIERFLKSDAEGLERLFQALDRGDAVVAERLRDELVKRGAQASTRLARLEQSVKRNVEVLLDAAGARELLAIRLLVALSLLTIVVGILMAFYARRVLRPLAAVTERAQAVARGDLEPRPAVVSDDEIGELALTFERMVAAIAEANAQLLTSERLVTIGKMAAHVTHEIRNPLSSIALNLELLEEQLPSGDAEAHDLFRAIGREVERLSALSQQYLAIARRKPGMFEPEDVGAVVQEAVAFVRRELEQKGLKLVLEIAQDLPSVRCDEGQLRQALLNLIQNARDATPEGGTVTVRVKQSDDGVAITVEDEGPGIEPRVREQLFEPFFTTKAGGTGLGLAITRNIAVSHGGSIECEPLSGGRGTRFVLTLPGPEHANLVPAAAPH